MKAKEKRIIYKMPPKWRPLGAWAVIGYNILFMLPVIGLICIIIFSISSGNICRRSMARAYLLVTIIAAVLIGGTVLVLYFAFPEVWNMLVLKCYELWAQLMLMLGIGVPA